MTQLSTLLLVDPDPHGLETLTYGFEREGYTVAGTSDPGQAPELLRTSAPQLAVVSLRGPDRGHLDLIRTLGSSNGRSVPVVGLGSADLRADALAAGAGDFLTTPLFVRDVISVGKLLALAAGPHAERSPDEQAVEIESRLSDYHGLFYLLRAMSAAGRSGILIMTRGHRRAELRFSDGTVTGAHVAAAQGLPAVHHLLLWEEAMLLFKFRAVPGRSQLHLSAQELLDECERFLRDIAFSARDLGAAHAVYTAAPDRDAAASGMQPSQVGPVLRLFDGQRRFIDVVEESPFRVFDTLRVIKRLLDSGTVVAAPGAATPEGPSSLMEQWAVVPDMRGVVGDRRRSQRKLKPVPSGAEPPIALTLKKASGELAPRKANRTPPPVVLGMATEPTVQVKVQVDTDAAALPAAAPLVPSDPAPLTALEPRRPTPAPLPTLTPAAAPAPAQAPAVARKPRQTGPRTPLERAGRTPAPILRPDAKDGVRKPAGGTPAPVRLTPNTAFDAVEADFFAREADLYRREAVENFDDLDPGGDAESGKRRPGGGSTRKKR